TRRISSRLAMERTNVRSLRPASRPRRLRLSPLLRGRLEHLRLGVVELALDPRSLASQLAHLAAALPAGALYLAVEICELQLHPLDLGQCWLRSLCSRLNHQLGHQGL